MRTMVFVSDDGRRICFDDYVKDCDFPIVWVGMCRSCEQKFRNILKHRCDADSSAHGMCSVLGCNNEVQCCIDFYPEEVEFYEETVG